MMNEVKLDTIPLQKYSATILDQVDLLRVNANRILDTKKKSSLGQYFTPAPICRFMASLFSSIEEDVKVLDPGCGVGSLFAGFTDEVISRGRAHSLQISGFEIDPKLTPFYKETLRLAEEAASKSNITLSSHVSVEDFILHMTPKIVEDLFWSPTEQFSHAIINPPYKKIRNDSQYRKILRLAGIEVVNIYAAFISLAVKLLEQGGELVAILPRSFCNGTYYLPFRKLLLTETSIEHIHIFDRRDNAFADDDVLQENIILHCIKGKQQSTVTITSSPTSDFVEDFETGTITATDMTIRHVSFENLVRSNDPEKMIYIAPTELDQKVIEYLSCFSTRLDELDIEVSTGAVVDFRLKEDLREELQDGCVPLLYSAHFNHGIHWPIKSKKPNAINVSEKTQRWLWKNKGHFVITRRFSSKDENKRIVAYHYDSSLPGRLIGFDNKLNVFHKEKKGLKKFLAIGLSVYLNSTLLDKYYRQFGGHTQVNAGDLRALSYPSRESLIRIGRIAGEKLLRQDEIDAIIEQEIKMVLGEKDENPLEIQNKIDQAIQVLKALGFPRAQQNDRSALTLLALLNLHPDRKWSEIERPMRGVTPIMDWCRDVYAKEYAPNTRETFRRQTLHQFLEAGIVSINPDKPDRAVNSPKTCYQITLEVFQLLSQFESEAWNDSLESFLENYETLIQQYAKERELEMIPLKVSNDREIKLSPGSHSQLIKQVIYEFGPRFVPGSLVIYIGDTGGKTNYFLEDELDKLGVVVDNHGKLPDVILYYPDKKRLLLIEVVTSHGPVDAKRYGELADLFQNVQSDLVYVTIFPDRRTMSKYLADISWETEVWIADSPTHLIHFNGDKFLGPYSE